MTFSEVMHGATVSRLARLGFGRWAKTADGNTLMLIPEELEAWIPPNATVTSIMGARTKFGRASRDVRYGCYAVGFVVEDDIGEGVADRPATLEKIRRALAECFPEEADLLQLRIERAWPKGRVP